MAQVRIKLLIGLESLERHIGVRTGLKRSKRYDLPIGLVRRITKTTDLSIVRWDSFVSLWADTCPSINNLGNQVWY
jgi:hypothetical protein